MSELEEARGVDAMAETRFLASKTYEWVLEGDIAACFDEISHTALMDRVRARVNPLESWRTPLSGLDLQCPSR